MSCAHTKDSAWLHDLIWKYLHEDKSKPKSVGHWYNTMDPLGTVLEDRHRVYEMLVDEPAHGNPDGTQVGTSMIPWNQNNKAFLNKVGGGLWCGSIVKIFFWKYMGWGASDPPGHSTTTKGFDAAHWVMESLASGRPVRARLSAHHYVGIVGAKIDGLSIKQKRFKYAFLCIDPWAGGATTAMLELDYGGGKTSFLGVVFEQDGKLVYDGAEIDTVEGLHPITRKR